jgi:autotransporter-associated beta strand protein
MAGASLTIEGGSLGAGKVTGGLGVDGGESGKAFGGGMFLQGGETVTVAPAARTVETIFGVIADESGGVSGSLILDGAGTLDLDAANTYTGGTTIDQGVLELASAKAAGSGGINFASASGELEYAAKVSVDIGNTISGFDGKDKIDFAKVKYAAGDHAVLNTSGNVTVETSAGATVATFNVSGTYASANFHVGADRSGDLLVSYATATADILGGYATEFTEPSRTRAGDLSEFDSWSALASSAGTDSSGFGFHEANIGGWRDPLGVGICWDGATGHGPSS